ncbi:MAG TPA: ATP-binding protein [Polyangiaceae bacterium]|nr:ATP-binding protein [Polyangiaceae bacterium]
MTSNDPRAVRDTKLWLRILLLGLTGTLPLFVVSLDLINGSYSGAIAFCEKEQRGNAFERSLERLLEELPTYEAAARRAVATDASDRRELSLAQQRIDQALQAVAMAQAAELRSAAQLNEVQREWERLKEAPLVVAAAHAATNQLLESVRGMIRYTGDHSNLILDDDLDSYYLMEITLNELPQTEQRLADITSQVTDWLASGQARSKQTQIAVFAAELREADLERIRRDAQTALSEDARFNGVSASLQHNLPPAVARLDFAEQSLLTQLDRVVAGDAVPPTAIEAAGWTAYAESFRLFDRGADELDGLLASRIRAIQNTRLQGYSIIIATLGLAAFAMTLIMRSLAASRRAEIRKTQEELSVKETQLRALGDNLPGGMVYQLMREIDGSMRFLYISGGVEQLYGVSAEAAMADSELIYGQIEPEDRALLLAQQRRSSTETGIFNTTVRMRRPDATTRTLELFSALRLLSDGRAVWDGIQMDVTDRQRAEAAIKQSELRFSCIFDHSPIPITLSSFPDGRVIAANDSFLTFSGFTNEEVIGRTTAELGIYQDPSDRAVVVEQLRTHGHVHSREQAFRSKSGEIRHSLLWVDVITITGEEYILALSLDLTEQKRTEQQKALLEEQLRQAQKLDALGTLAGGIAHDFNNILGAIICYSQLSKLDNPDNQALQANLQQVLNASARATNLVRQILSFSRQQKEEREPLQLAPIVREALSMLRAGLPSTVSLEHQLEAPVSNVLGNPTQVHQIVMNLCTNSAHAMKGKQGQIKVALREVEVLDSGPRPHVELQPGGYVCLSVQDTGHGMDAATAKRIFEPFFTTKGPGEGTGLGLSVVHGIVKEYGGVVTVDSQLGQGTSFAIYLPARPAVDKPAVVANEVPLGNGERILFVDDEAVLGDVAQQMMQRLGYQPTVFQSSAAALAAFQSNPAAFDALITDFTMPAMTGIELAGQILESRPALPVILVSGSSGQLTASELHKAGIRELLSKPLDYGTLARVLNRALHE